MTDIVLLINETENGDVNVVSGSNNYHKNCNHSCQIDVAPVTEHLFPPFGYRLPIDEAS